MPEIDGIDTTIKLREIFLKKEFIKTKIIALTTCDKEEIFEKIFDFYMQKPLNFELLKKYINE